jgi:hypothetical protein
MAIYTPGMKSEFKFSSNQTVVITAHDPIVGMHLTRVDGTILAIDEEDPKQPYFVEYRDGGRLQHHYFAEAELSARETGTAVPVTP